MAARQKPKVLDRRLKLEYREVGKLRPYEKNSRQHPPEQIAKLCEVIKRVGFVVPILVDEKDGILKGHGGLQAARQLGMRSVPVIELSHLTAAEKRAYIIADNRIAEDSGWDRDILRAEMLDLSGMGFDLSLTGFDASEISLTLAPPASEPTEPPPARPQGPITSRPGDLWLMGEHRLICADSTKPETYERLLEGRRVQCVFTDPPYGVSYEARSGQFEVIKGDDLRRGQLEKLLQGAFGNAAEHAADDAGWYVWHASSTREDFARALRDAGLVELGYLIWVKPGMVLGWSDYRWAHEPCFYAARQGVKPAFYGDRTDTTVWRARPAGDAQAARTTIGTGVILTTADGRELYVAGTPPKGRKLRHVSLKDGETAYLEPTHDNQTVWEVGRDAGHGKGNSVHPTQKPVELVRRALRNSTREGEAVLDMFSGGASTIIGAEQTGRVGYAIELDPQYVDAGVRRWQELTGKEAMHAEEKRTFDAIAKERAGRKAGAATGRAASKARKT